VTHPWFRIYPSILTDDALTSAPLATKWCWIAVLCVANDGSPRGSLNTSHGIAVTPERLARKARVRVKEAEKALAFFREEGMIAQVDGLECVDRWDDYQFESDCSTDRVKAYRERCKERSRNVTETHQSRTETETEQKQRENARERALPPCLGSTSGKLEPSDSEHKGSEYIWREFEQKWGVPSDVDRALLVDLIKQTCFVGCPKTRKQAWHCSRTIALKIRSKGNGSFRASAKLLGMAFGDRKDVAM
jgi:hypothetical protein